MLVFLNKELKVYYVLSRADSLRPDTSGVCRESSADVAPPPQKHRSMPDDL